MSCPLFQLEPQLTARQLNDRARRTLNTQRSLASLARLQRLANHPNADSDLRQRIAQALQ